MAVGSHTGLGADVGSACRDQGLSSGHIAVTATELPISSELFEVWVRSHPGARIGEGPNLGHLASTTVQPVE